MRGVRVLNKSLAAIVALALNACLFAPAAFAMSTSQEIAQGKAENAEINSQSIVLHDPFLTSWVGTIGGKLAANRRRRDIDYQFIILDEPDINAFAIKGGFVHVDVGLLNFVASDDELASTLGHEMGHVELRHVVNGSNQDTILGILTTIVSMISPIAGVLGGIGTELASEKYSRADELQADHYGLRLMATAGYDPEAAIDVMSRLGAMDPGPDSRADKAFIDHPVPQDRVSHLLGYPELDQPSEEALTAHGIHDQSEGLFKYANVRLAQAAKAGQDDALINDHETQIDYALRESGARAAPDGRVELSLAGPSDPRRVVATAAVRSALSAATAAETEAKKQARAGGYELDDLAHHIDLFAQTLQGATQGPGGGSGSGSGPGPGQPGATPTHPPGENPVAHLTRDISATVNLLGDVLSVAPGLVTPNADALREMAGPLDDPAPLTPKYQALLGYYPQMTASLDESTQQVLDSIAQSREAIAQAQTALQMSAGAMAPRALEGGDRNQPPAHMAPPDLSGPIAAWDAALAKAQRASDLVYAAQTSALSTEITLLDVLSAPERYADFRKALLFRFPGEVPPSYAAASASSIPPGEIACAAWYAFETHVSVNDVMTAMRSDNRSCEQMALSNDLLGESMEIAEGLVYEDYIDVPAHVPGH
jgi:Zn-dependent protease with chaperone function